MNNKEITKEDVLKENQFLKLKLSNTLQTLANQQDYTLDLETELHIAHETLRALNKQEEQAQG
ncbi:hypothetical protein [Mammaliicoccus sciuri]|uniref:hypothetical protein n=1 Tax=Mammaliicoccus sciuri TaxID=1296 RepID=UPI0021D0491C|nr:hypothetical protein [Mammaliicoccus sciuri]UXU70089.1 hypothetical protein MUA36_05255 [Mammaliicoccus sciuri]